MSHTNVYQHMVRNLGFLNPMQGPLTTLKRYPELLQYHYHHNIILIFENV